MMKDQYKKKNKLSTIKKGNAKVNTDKIGNNLGAK